MKLYLHLKSGNEMSILPKLVYKLMKSPSQESNELFHNSFNGHSL